MIVLEGKVVTGAQHFTKRFKNYPQVFRNATGEDLFPGTINIDVDQEFPPREHFRISGTLINEPEQDLLFEICRINGNWAYGIRPYHLSTGGGGHGDHILEITCAKKINNVTPGSRHKITLFRQHIR